MLLMRPRLRLYSPVARRRPVWPQHEELRLTDGQLLSSPPLQKEVSDLSPSVCPPISSEGQSSSVRVLGTPSLEGQGSRQIDRWMGSPMHSEYVHREEVCPPALLISSSQNFPSFIHILMPRLPKKKFLHTF